MAIDNQLNKLQQICYELGDNQHINRLRAYKEVEQVLKENQHNDDYLDLVQRNCLELLANTDYHKIMGGFMASQLLIAIDTRAPERSSFKLTILEDAIRHLEDEELRVRQEVCKVLQLVASKIGNPILAEKKDCILGIIERDYNRDNQKEQPYELSELNQTQNQQFDQKQPLADDNILSSLLQAYKPPKPGSGEMRHHTEGYKSLETSVKAIQSIIEGVKQYIVDIGNKPTDQKQKSASINSGQKLADVEQNMMDSQIDDRLLKIIITCSLHQSKFVRMTSYETLGVIADSVGIERLHEVGKDIILSLADGLSDPESQVRYCACVASRQCLVRFPSDSISSDLSPIVPALCLNRYYVADGVRNYALETWKVVMGDKGKNIIADNFEIVLKYYINQTKVKNHAIREAACMSLGEIASKIDKEVVEKNIDRILYALLKAMKDNSWPVRDSAGVGLRLSILKYPEQSRQIRDPYLEQNFQQLSENVQTVRENSAMNIGAVLQVYKDEIKDKVNQYLRENLQKAKDQEQIDQVQQFSSDFENISLSNQGQNGQNAGQNKSGIQNQNVNSMFGSQNIKTRKRGQGGAVDMECCIDAGYTRERQKWEYSDGCVFLVREVAGLIDLEDIQYYLEVLEDLLRLDHFQQSFNLKTTIFKCLPDIAKNMGKRQFKVYLPNFIPFLFKNLECSNLNCEAAAGEAIQQLRDLIGPTIFDGRLDMDQKAKMRNPNIPPIKYPS